MTGTEATLLKLGITMIQRSAPTGIAYIKSWLKGKKVMVVGQGRAGKSTFIDYLQYGLFEDEQETDKTVDIVLSARFNIKLGRDQALELDVQTITDMPGQIGATAHAQEVVRVNPQAVIILLDLTSPVNGDSDRASASWLTEFCKEFENKWRINKRKKNKLKSIILVLNKTDKVDAKTVDKRKKLFRKILDQEIRNARGTMNQEIAITSTVFVTNPEGTKSADSLIANLAKSLMR